MSSPICVLYIGALLALRHRARLLHWAMDLHPDLAVALGELPEGLIQRLIHACMCWAYHRCETVVTLDEEMAARIDSEYHRSAEVIPLWPFQPVLIPSSDDAGFEKQRWIWLYSGNLGKGHLWQPLLEVQKTLEEKDLPVWLVFQGGGPATKASRKEALQLGLKRVEWRDYAGKQDLVESLLKARILIATQREETAGLLWPSKLALAFCLPRPVLWIGPKDGAVARMLRQQHHHGVFGPGDLDGITAWIESYYRTTLPIVFDHLPDSVALREKGLERWMQKVENRQ